MKIYPSWGGWYEVDNPKFYADTCERSYEDENGNVHFYSEPTVYFEDERGWLRPVATCKTRHRAKRLAHKATRAKVDGAQTLYFCDMGKDTQLDIGSVAERR